MICEKCGKREAEYDSPGDWCEVCWAEWWFEGMVPENDIVRKELIAEASEKIRNITEITNLPEKERPDAIRKIAERMIQPAGSSSTCARP